MRLRLTNFNSRPRYQVTPIHGGPPKSPKWPKWRIHWLAAAQVIAQVPAQVGENPPPRQAVTAKQRQAVTAKQRQAVT